MNKPKLAVLTSRFPYPIDKGDKLRLYHQLRDLSKHFSVHLFALHEKFITPESYQIIEPYCEKIQLYSLSFWQWPIQALHCLWHKQPLQMGYFFNSRIHANLKEAILLLKPDVVYVQLARMMPYADNLPFPIVLDLQDCFSLNYTRTAQQTSRLKSLFYQREARTMMNVETHLLKLPIETCIIAEHDKNALPVQPNQTHIVPNGVDTFFFQPLNDRKPFDLVFVGNLSYQPNQDAVRFLCEAIMPRLLQRMPHIRLLIAGANMPESMKQWESKHIECLGWVKDIRTAYASAKLFVAPLFSGAGVQNKMLEAMSMGMACITTPLVNASLNAPVSSVVLTANDAQSFCASIEALLNNPEQVRIMGESARKWVETNFQWHAANAKLIALIQQTINKQAIA